MRTRLRLWCAAQPGEDFDPPTPVQAGPRQRGPEDGWESVQEKRRARVGASDHLASGMSGKRENPFLCSPIKSQFHRIATSCAFPSYRARSLSARPCPAAVHDAGRIARLEFL